MAVLLHLAADMVWHFEVRIALVMWRESIMVEHVHCAKNEAATYMLARWIGSRGHTSSYVRVARTTYVVGHK